MVEVQNDRWTHSPFQLARFAWAGLVTVALVTGGCASSAGGGRDVQGRSAAPAEESATSPATARVVEAMELREGAPSTFLDIRADGPLVWTSYRDAQGHLIIELPNAVTGPAVGDLERGEGLVASVEVEQQQVAERPLTRLKVMTRSEAEHSLDADGDRLRLELLPVAGTRQAETTPSYEPLPIDEVAEEDAGTGMEEEPFVAEVATEPGSAPAPQPTQSETPDTRQQAFPSSPATVLANVSVVPTQGGAAIRVIGDGTFRYSTMALNNPDRYVIDLEGVVNASDASTVEVAEGGVERVRVAQFQPFPNPVARVVFDLSLAQEPYIEATADGIIVRFGDAVADQRPPAEPAPSLEEPAEVSEAPSQSSQVAEILPPPVAEEEIETAPIEVEEEAAPVPVEMEVQTAALDEPEPGQQETLEVATPDTSAEPAMVETETTLVAEDAAAEEILPPAEEVTTVEVVEVEPAPVEVETTVAVAEEETFEEWPETTYQDDPVEEELPISDVAMFEAAEVQYEAPTEESQDLTTLVSNGEVVGPGGQTWRGDPISLGLRDADIKDVLRSFSTITGLNVVVHPGVRGSVTVELNDVPWDQALDLILRINNLDYVLEGNIMRIASSSDLQREAAERRALEAAQAEQVPLQTLIRAISYATAGEIASLLTTSQGAGGRILSPRGSVAVDRRTNKLIIKELPSNMNAVLSVIANLDTAQPQVLIEARIVETTKQFSRTLGIAWSFNGVSDEQFGNTTGLTFPHQGTVNGGVQLLTGGQTGFLDVTLGNVLNTFTLDASLQAAETEGLVSILSAPRIATLNNTQANIQSGLQIPIQTVANNTVSVQFVNATLELGVTPQVTAEGTVIMDINIAKRAPQPALAVAGATNAPISTKEARTRVIVRDGGTTVIGGIYEVTNDRGVDRVPGLANVPILGHLFRNKRRNNNNEELLIFLTPRVIQL